MLGRETSERKVSFMSACQVIPQRLHNTFFDSTKMLEPTMSAADKITSEGNSSDFLKFCEAIISTSSLICSREMSLLY